MLAKVICIVTAYAAVAWVIAVVWGATVGRKNSCPTPLKTDALL